MDFNYPTYDSYMDGRLINFAILRTYEILRLGKLTEHNYA